MNSTNSKNKFSLIILSALITLCIIYFPTSNDGFPPNKIKKEGWRLVLNEEFESTILNDSIWISEYFPGRFKTPIKANYLIKDGYLHLYEGSIQTFNTHNLHKQYYHLAKEVSTIEKFTQLYGYFEIRAKHSNTAHHVAFWALEAKNGGSEIDIIEDPAWVGPNWHKWSSKRPFPEGRKIVKKYDSITTKEQRASEFQLYALEVHPTGAKVYHNNILLEEVDIDWKKRGETPLMFLLSIYENKKNGQPYIIDYFRAYKKDDKTNSKYAIKK